MTIERDLERALRRTNPDPGFSRRVLKRIEKEQHQPRPVWWRAAAASVTLAALLGGYATHKVAEQRRADEVLRQGEEAKAQLLKAMYIAGEKVHLAQQEARAVGSQNE